MTEEQLKKAMAILNDVDIISQQLHYIGNMDNATQGDRWKVAVEIYKLVK